MKEYGEHTYRRQLAWLQSLARDGKSTDLSEAIKPAAPFLHAGRMFLTTATFGIKTATMIDQITGLASVALEAGPTDTVTGVLRWAKGGMVTPWSGGDAKSASKELDSRLDTWNRERRELHRSQLDPTRTATQKRRDTITSLLMLPIGLIQIQIDYMAWYAGVAKEQRRITKEAEVEGENPTEQIRLQQERIHHAGDSMVRLTQGGGQVKDMAAIQRGDELAKASTMYASYFVAQLSLAYRAKRKMQRAIHKPVLVDGEPTGELELDLWGSAQSLGYAVVTSATLVLIPELFNNMLQGELPGEDEEDDVLNGWGAWAMLASMTVLVGGVPIVRNIPEAIFDGKARNPITPLEWITRDVKGARILRDLMIGDISVDDLNEGQINSVFTLLSTGSTWLGGVPLPSSQLAQMTYLGLNSEDSERPIRDALAGIPRRDQ